ncbi:hypothetical protein [Vibrio navarrensis]|uniref:Uncharacterized protein n=1 Tax=Vibrio navarrensis TaxID=29495 RepID=A0AAJ4I9V3_9VIBR|nr:hypothetical protein [Vibrio navarrensis]QPL52992.1 hypothetical protein I3X05_13465 [Vibrio navarrensis]
MTFLSNYMCAHAGYFRREKVLLFRQWLLDEIANFQYAYPLTGIDVISNID